jgi:hypothetical protein
MEFDAMDPVFNPRLTNINDQFKEEALQQMTEIYNSRMAEISDNYKLLGEVIDVEESEDYKSGKFTEFKPGDDTFSLEEMKEPALKGSLKTACSLSDALVLQYYEANPQNVAFGKHLSMKQWKDIAEIKDAYQDVLFSAPKIATNIASPLLKEIKAELDNNTRSFSFLCGHDSNISSVMSALSIEDYNLPNAIEKTPIGCKLVFCKWVDSSGKEYISIDMVYQSIDQLKGTTLLDESNPPCIVELKFDGLDLLRLRLLLEGMHIPGMDLGPVPGSSAFDYKPDFENSAALSRQRFDYQFKLRIDPASRERYTMNRPSYRWLRAAFRATDLLIKNARKVNIPLLICQAGNDSFVDNAGQDRFISLCPSASRKFFPEAKHEIFLSGGKILEDYYDTILSFFREQV